MVIQSALAVLLRSSLALASFGGDAPLIGDPALESAGVYRFWQGRLPMMTGDSVEAGWLVEDSIYITTDRGGFFAVTAGEGLIRWAENLTEPDYRIYRPSHLALPCQADALVIPTTTFVAVFDRFSGALVRKFRPPFPASGPAIGYGDTLLMGSADGRFYSLLMADLQLHDPIIKWVVEAGGPVIASPVLYAGDLLAFASQAGVAHSCRADDKALAWSYQFGGPVVGDLAFDDTGVYVASTDRSLYKLDRRTGRRLWRTRLRRPLNVGPVVTVDTVYQFCPDYGLVAINPDSGEERWHVESGRSLISHTANGDFVFTDAGRIDLVDHADGTLKHSMPAPDVRAALLNTRDDALYLLGGDGRVLCARLDTVPYLRRQMVRAAQERLNKPPGDEAAVEAAGKNKPKPVDPRERDPLRSRFDVKPK